MRVDQLVHHLDDRLDRQGRSRVRVDERGLVDELTVRAVVEGSRELVYQAALVDPNTAATLSVEAIVDMVDELIDAHGDLIPEPIRRG